MLHENGSTGLLPTGSGRHRNATVWPMMCCLPPEMVLPFSMCAAFALGCWLLSVITREYSWVDRLWSITPPMYVAAFAWQAGFDNARLNLMTVLTALWGARLTFNFVRKGGYKKGGEDYRWEELRKKMSPAVYQVFNVVFISAYQHFLLLLIALPAWEAFRSSRPLGIIDYLLAAVFALLLVGETIADQQQWNFHQQKKARKERGEPEPKGFVDTGLWAWSRHPNFFCEVSIWWVIYAFAIAAGASALNATIVGAVLLTLLFQGSTNFTESITARKYPAYADYQRRVSRLIPWFAKR